MNGRRPLAPMLACALSAAAFSEAPTRLSIVLDARSWSTLSIGAETPLGNTGFAVTASLRAPLFRLASGDADSWEAAAGIVSRLGGEGPSLDYGAELTIAATDQVLGSFLQFGSRATVRPAWRWNSFSAGAALIWERGWITCYSPSPFVTQTFEDRYSGAAGSVADGWYAWGGNRLLIGPDLRGSLGRYGSWRAAGGARIVPGSLIAPMEGFPIGEWPFWMSCGWSYP